MKKLLITLTLACSTLILWGLGKLYIAYNLSHYAGYYVQHLPRKEGTNPELVIILTYLDDIERPEINGVSYNLKGNGAILLDNNIVLTKGLDIDLWNTDTNISYVFNDINGQFSYYYTDDIDKASSDKQYQKEAEVLLNKIITPILEAQPKPNINLQKLFNEKYYKQFN